MVCLTTFQLKSNASISSSVGGAVGNYARAVNSFLFAVGKRNRLHRCFGCEKIHIFVFNQRFVVLLDKQSAVHLFHIERGAIAFAGYIVNLQKSDILLLSRISNASQVYADAITISINILFISIAVASSTVPLIASIPPKTDTGSELYARIYASKIFSPVPTPQGFACLHATTAGNGTEFF